MAQAIGLTEAADALSKHFGERLDAAFEEGMQLMTDALREDLHLSGREARRLVDELVEARSVRWIESGGPEPTAPAPSMGLPFGAAMEPVGGGIPLRMRPGYWQISGYRAA